MATTYQITFPDGSIQTTILRGRDDDGARLRALTSASVRRERAWLRAVVVKDGVTLSDAEGDTILRRTDADLAGGSGR